ncbi:hypothetical protein CLAFUW4_09332 [Fulvia fulva]|uniref:Uncharacterized protein n=1 Tax=Passalora fulva TaxID=5499 RepID=A0A9Q8UTE5_PASFU|nr:uncharacterized protein CLAFUR5_09432 [Fulvia fulva]KAK4614084.1 hypothetical protein CLAFUR4_09338 [Fulvia fulva]KAK4614782.1 hypothetical protein CLAFUR0_09330 [Fulvia fulva]UJO21864.1 hypothetical protein CLAFUR5_09432 [Fulvia fulva]WPV20328.1 hypothetical protein CLAFUW4_09332 [Fulvia fulva]WPV35625.1 hypothetical protein CLAFUW7_09333 [Fulvia fulva]
MLPGSLPITSINDFPGAATGDKLRKFFASLHEKNSEPRSSARSTTPQKNTPASSNDNTPASSRAASVTAQQSSRSSSVVSRAVAKGYYAF